jgi:shikimate dehydrogenase
VTLRLAVIGDPVAHSRSPEYQRGFLAEAGLSGTYEAIRVAAGTGAERIDALRAAGFLGLNVTTPLKEEAFARADFRDPIATASGAVNTLVLGRRIEGYNTDGAGALGALADVGLRAPAGRRVLVLGAGATARAVVFALVSAKVDVLLWNRTAAAAERLARDAGAKLWSMIARVDAVYSTLPPDADIRAADLIAALTDAPLVIDANYGERATLGTRLGRTDVHDGRAMLRASARASFEIFTAALRRGGDSNSRDL